MGRMVVEDPPTSLAQAPSVADRGADPILGPMASAVGQTTCDRCEAELVPDAAYCDRCGERTRRARRTVRLAIRIELLVLLLVILLIVGFSWIYWVQR